MVISEKTLAVLRQECGKFWAEQAVKANHPKVYEETRKLLHEQAQRALKMNKIYEDRAALEFDRYCALTNAESECYPQ